MIKRLIFRLLCNRLTGETIRRLCGARVPNIRWPGFAFDLTSTSISPRFIASVYWGFYESAEVRLVERYLPSDRDVIELGASIGVVSGHIAAKLEKERRLVAVEPNPLLLCTLRSNIARHLRGATAAVEHAAFSTSGNRMVLSVAGDNDHTATQLGVSESDACPNGIQVPALSLSDIIRRHRFERFTLVCDIEGAEIELLRNDLTALVNCENLFIELHQTRHGNEQYSVNQLAEIIEKEAHFSRVDMQGNAFYFSKQPTGCS